MIHIPNYCSYRIIAAGYQSNINYFLQIMQNDYDKTHMYRIFEALPDYQTQYGLWKRIEIVGDCAWSIWSCMFPGDYTYYTQDFSRHKNNVTENVYNYKTKQTENVTYTMENFKGTNLLELAKQLRLDIYAFGQEPGMGFVEEYRILPNGLLITNHEGWYRSYYLGEGEDKGFKEYCDYWGYKPEELPFNEDDFNEMVEDGVEDYDEMEFECNYDSIPYKPNYFTNNYLYKVINNKKGK